MITANEAKEFTTKNKTFIEVKDALDKLEQKIIEVSKEGKNTLSWREYPISGKLYSNNKVPEYEMFRDILENLGYTVDMSVENHNLGVDIWVDISW